SIAGRLPAPREGAYSASKHALAAMSECMAIDLQGTGVTVHLVTPGVIDTPLWEVPGQEESPTSGDDRTPPGDVADAVIDLLRTGRFETYVPARFRLPAVVKPLMGGAFLKGTSRFDRRRVPEAHE
ncbi:MAG: SDR family oxidoreductase, partial [Actinobacteria bacterium]|nr:SDR family oxidoreductase [Actinomycetota bacterium]